MCSLDHAISNARLKSFPACNAGLRVRMGVYTGVHLPITVDASLGRARLPPTVLTAAKAIADAGRLGWLGFPLHCVFPPSLTV